MLGLVLGSQKVITRRVEIIALLPDNYMTRCVTIGFIFDASAPAR